MRIESAHRLRGPNRYLPRPVVTVRVELDELTERETTDHPGFTEALLAMLPGLAGHHCAGDRPGGFVKRLHGGTYFGHVAEHIALELSAMIGRDVTFGRTTLAGPAGCYDVVMECPRDEPPSSVVPRALIELAAGIVDTLIAGGEPEWQTELASIRAVHESERPGPSTEAIAAAARRREIPVERVGRLGLLRLGYGRHRRLVWAAMTDRTPAVGTDIVGDKQLTREFLAAAGIPVPTGQVAHSVQDAMGLLAELGAPLVVKPRKGRQGNHVYLDLCTPREITTAFAEASRDGDVLVERQFEGRDYRVLMVAGEVVAAAERRPAHVVGDGVHDIAALVELVNADPRRGEHHDRALTRLRLDAGALRLLAEQGRSPASVPAVGETVWLCANANLSTGGTSRDVTDEVHPDVAELCRRTVAAVGMDVAGIDLRLPDIAEPLEPTSADKPATAGVIEVNAAPGLRMHLSPSAGRARRVGTAIVDAMYPPGTPTRIPIVSVTGTNGKTTTTRLIAHLLGDDGRRVGVTTSDGVYIDGRLVHRADATGPASADMILGDPTVDIAVLETARGGIVRRGLGYEWSDVGVITNIEADHLGQDGISTIEDLVDVKSLVAERIRDGGALVLNADDADTVEIARRRPVRAAYKDQIWFGTDSDNPVITDHLRAGGRAFLAEGDRLVEATGPRREVLMHLADIPGSFDGKAPHAVANALAAVAAARALGVPAEVVAAKLRSFDPWTGNPGRSMLWNLDGVDLLVDYAHNAPGLAAMADTVAGIWDGAVAAVTFPGDRRDDLLEASARAVAEGFDRVVVYEDVDKRGRGAGETAALIRDTVAAHRPAVDCRVEPGMEEALPAAMALAQPGEVVLLTYEKLAPAVALLESLGATPVTAPRLFTFTPAVTEAIGRG
ncbi:cyanophycin synthetase [Phytomonospora sp. NPDC050363]|uniref:cyanophycin synthetase n=1 Tax=Phytomonospora sp. NPDC050363 TaxID=3155642 RepID=UPI0033E68DAC